MGSQKEMFLRMLNLLLVCSQPLPAISVDLDCNLRNGFDIKNKQNMLNEHNLYRNQIANNPERHSILKIPTATNMRKMAWSCDLEKSAQQVADSLIDCSVPHYSPTGGQTVIRFKYNTTETYSQWYLQDTFNSYCRDEFYVSLGELQLIPNRNNYRGMQRIWWKTDKLGCGLARCRNRHWRQNFIIVCHYSPAGNTPGEQSYEPGPPCSNCGNGLKCDNTTKDEESLCIPV